MKTLLPLLLLSAALLAAASAASEVSEMEAAEDALAAASESVAEGIRARREGGYKMRRGKKVTKESRLMGERNAVFSRAMKHLAEEEAMEEARAGEAVAAALNRMARRNRRKPSGFGNVFIEEFEVPPDLCANETATDCTGASDQFRTIDGRCNNLQAGKGRWGSAGVPFRRMAQPRYQDNVNEPLGGKPSSSSRTVAAAENNALSDRVQLTSRAAAAAAAGESRTEHPCPRDSNATTLPNARFISSMMHKAQDGPDLHVTHLLTQMGQFVDHDITLTAEAEEDSHDCCADDSQENCFAIEIPADDPFYKEVNETCMEFGRSERFCAEYGGVREQFNGITSFVDASNVYGSDLARSGMIRKFEKGLLLVDCVESDLLPILEVEENGIMIEARVAGDVRAHEMPGLASMHTLFVREHNKIAQAIYDSQTAEGSTDEERDENIFQRARVAVIAEMQKIVYHDYLPLVTGKRALKRHNIYGGEYSSGQRSSYEPDLDPTITNEFATAAYRFGHSMIQGSIEMWTKDGDRVAEANQLRKLFFTTDRYARPGGIDQIFSGLINQNSQFNNELIDEELTQHLFPEDGKQFGGDLAARNIQRGRDHGLPGYNDIRRACSMDPVCDWDSRPEEFLDDVDFVWQQLRGVYETTGTPPGDMDLFTAGLGESPLSGGVVGQTFACVIAHQFEMLQKGDRFFFTHPPAGHPSGSSGLTDDQLDTVLTRTLRDLICEHTKVEYAQQDVFDARIDPEKNPLTSCHEFNTLDTTVF